MSAADHELDVVVIGAGQAGLSAGYFLRRAALKNGGIGEKGGDGSGFVIVDHGKRAGGAWQYRWPSLRFDRVHGLHDLPGMSLGQVEPQLPASEVVSEYFASYERTFDLPVHRPAEVRSVRRTDDDRLLVETAAESWAARAVINATGTWGRPFWPRYPGQELFTGRQLHTADYADPEAFRRKRVVVVGGGTSAVQLLMEIAPYASNTTWVTRKPPVFRTGEFTPEIGRAAVAKVERAVRAGRPPESVVSVTGLMLTPEIAAARESGILERRPMFHRITARSVVWEDGTEEVVDVILWATGFRAALDHLAPLRIREPGGGIHMDGTRVVAEPRLHLVGYGPSASTIGATRAGRSAVHEIQQLLAHSTPQ
jgi:cation diffusion facilitator CzcD-associated flavoprotein CzcO